MDISQSSWDEIDASNSQPAPNGAPEGMSPGGLNDTIRADRGAIKRFWNKINAVQTTAGTASAFTLTYDQAPDAYADGEIISFVAHATNAADATINLNALGAKPLRQFGGNLLQGAFVAGQIVQGRYSSSAGAFDLIPQRGWNVLATATPSGASPVSFSSIPAGVNHLMLVGDLTPSTDGADIQARTAGADGNYDTGASDYTFLIQTIESDGDAPISASSGDAIPLAASVDNGTFGMSLSLQLSGIQRAKRTLYEFDTHWLNSAGTVTIKRMGSGTRAESAVITGLQVFSSTGTLTGTLTLFASA